MFRNMNRLLVNQDWVKAILMAGFAIYVLRQGYKKTELLLKGETGFTEMAVDSENMSFPSFTFCPSTINWRITQHATGYRYNNQFDNIINITAGWQNKPQLEETIQNTMLDYLTQRISINKYG